MALKHIDGFDQYQGQSQATLLSSLTAAGYAVASGLAMADSRKVGGYALELQVTPGTAGESWSSRTNNAKQDLFSIDADAAGRFIAVGNTGVAVTSPDNVAWLPLVLGTVANLRSVKENAGTWIIVGADSTILRSTDGANFSARTAPTAAVAITDVAYGNGRWVAVGTVGAAGAIFTSDDDGLTWVLPVSGGGAAGNQCVEYGTALWMVGGVGGQILTSVDGAAWTARSVGVALAVNDLLHVGDHWLAAVSTDIRRSNDGGVTWAVTAAAIMTSTILSLAQSDGRFMAAGLQGAVRMSDNETDWTTPSFTGASTTPLYGICAISGATAGWAVVGAQNLGQASNVRRALIYVSLAPPTVFSRTYNTDSNKFTIGFAHRATSRGKILSMPGVLEMDWPAGVSILGEYTTAVPARNVWYFYELTFDKVALTVDLHINDVLDLTATLPGGVAAMNSFVFNWISENGAVTRLDDIYFVDQTAPNGELLLDRLGPITVPIRMPTSDATPNNWVGGVGGPHWPQIGLLPPSPTSYIRSAVSGAQDLFLSTDVLPDGAGSVEQPIIAVGVMALAQKGDIDNRALGLVIGAVALQKEVVDTSLSVTPEYSYAIFESAPNNAPWDATNVLATPFGVTVRP